MPRAVLVLALSTLLGSAAPPSGGTPGVPGAEPTARPRTVLVEREAWVMGTRLRVGVEATGEATAGALGEVVVREVERVESLLSTWDPGSALSAVNASAPGEPVPAPAELLGLLAEVESWARRTGRAFDPTVGPLVDAWDVRGGGRTPAPATLSNARAAIGPGAFRWDVEAGVAVRRSPAGRIDAGGFGKGAALRSVARRLGREPAGEPLSVAVDLGGQHWVSPRADAPVRVAVAHPARRHEAVAVLELGDGAVSVATSGHSERPGHLLDPRTGRPTAPWGSVTVVAEDPLEADVLSTALYVMGPEAGTAWADARADVAALFLVVRDGSVHAEWTAALSPFLTEAPSTAPR